MASRSRSRSPLQTNKSFLDSGRISPALSHASETSITSNNSAQKESNRALGKYLLRIVNVPLYWKWNNVSTYVKKYTNSVDKSIGEDIAFITMKKGDNENVAVLAFKTLQKRDQAFELLKQTYNKIDGRRLFVHKISADGLVTNLYQKPKFTKKQNNAPFSTEHLDTYGLSVDYLMELGIKPPLTRKVFVRYLPETYDEAKVRSIFSEAGMIESISVLHRKSHANARIEYDHPVEAVQAVSMFNNRELYGKQLKCEMDGINKIWTEGMPVQGPGLGPNGAPMRGVRVSVEIKKVKAEIMNEYQKLHESIEELKSQIANLVQANIAQQINTPVQVAPSPIVANPLTALSNLLTNQLQPMQLLKTIMQQNSGNDLGVLGTALQNMMPSNTNMIQAQNPTAQVQGSNVANMQGPMQSGHNILSGPMQGSMQGGPNMSGFPNMQSGQMQGGPNMQGVSNNNSMSISSNIQRGPNLQSGQMQEGHNMFNGPNMQSGPNMQNGQNMQSGPNYMQSGFFNSQNSGPNQCNNNMQPGFSNIQNMQSSSGPGLNQQINAGFGAPQFNNNMGRQELGSSTMLLFKNLPISVTYQALHAKMREVGEVKYVQLTGPGRALVNFMSDHDADKCIRLFNHSKVDGQIIEVKKT